MKKYKRIEKQVRADQYFPYKKIDIPGFENVLESLFNQHTMQEITICTHAVIKNSHGSMKIEPGDWILVDDNGQVSKRSHEDFSSDFEPIDAC